MTIETKNKNYVSIVILHLYSLHHLRHIVAFHSVLPPLEEEQQTDTVAYGQSATQLAFAYIYERGKAFRRDCSFRSFLYPGYNTVAEISVRRIYIGHYCFICAECQHTLVVRHYADNSGALELVFGRDYGRESNEVALLYRHPWLLCHEMPRQ